MKISKDSVKVLSSNVIAFANSLRLPCKIPLSKALMFLDINATTLVNYFWLMAFKTSLAAAGIGVPGPKMQETPRFFKKS